MFLLHIRKTLLHFTRNHPSLLDKSSSVFYFSTTSKLKHPPISSIVSDFLTQKHQISLPVAYRVASALTHVQNTEKLDSFISFFTENGFSKTQLERVMKTCPFLLVADIESTINPKFNHFKDFGFSPSEITGIFSKEPGILQSSLPNRIAPALPVLNGLLGSHDDVVKLLMSSGSSRLLRTDLEKTLLPNIYYLMSCGVPKDQIRRFLCHSLRFFLHKPEQMKQFVAKADQLGVDRSSRLLITAVKAVSSMGVEAWDRKLQALREFGFSEDGITNAFRQVPTMFALSLKKLNTTKEVLLATGKYPTESILSTPLVLIYSVEKRYKPRLRVLEVLERKNLITKWPGLTTLCSLTDAEFFEKFVAPHGNEISELWPKAASA